MTALFLFLTRTTLKRNNPRLGSGRQRLVYIDTQLKFARVEPQQECGHVLNVYSELKYPWVGMSEYKRPDILKMHAKSYILGNLRSSVEEDSD